MGPLAAATARRFAKTLALGRPLVRCERNARNGKPSITKRPGEFFGFPEIPEMFFFRCEEVDLVILESCLGKRAGRHLNQRTP